MTNTTLQTASQAADEAHEAFISAIKDSFPGCTEWDWYRALPGSVGRHVPNPPLAAHAGIKAAHDEYIRLLHVFYQMRDGERGFLGGRG